MPSAVMPSAVMSGASASAFTGEFRAKVKQAPQSDLSIFSLDPTIDVALSRRPVEKTKSSCLCVRNSGLESALA